ncbi:hypothetical protein TUM19329_34170 [Legionella antarctica]|uniref:Uncharacterized protein n=1 Tax=Legionella antarctica TaxID=2708020 RepID=A0A6F8TAP9_9GAMM|nr:hypothetical protein [Legionella antarctica]BCA97056.1 hypothetical protein TUM19329_34170 [Legionella antarctica]
MKYKIKEVRFTHTFYHATAEANVASILERGLLISQRGTNPFGLDYDIDYKKIYGSEKAMQHDKPPSIHLTEDFKIAIDYQQRIQQSHNQPALILKITTDSRKDILKPDSEDAKAYICLNNIERERISVSDNQNSLANDSDASEYPDEEEVLDNCSSTMSF